MKLRKGIKCPECNSEQIVWARRGVIRVDIYPDESEGEEIRWETEVVDEEDSWLECSNGHRLNLNVADVIIGC